MVSASVGNVMACVDIDEADDRWLTQAPVADVRNVLDELERLQTIEERLKLRISSKGHIRATLLENARVARDQWQIEDALEWERRARLILEEINGMEELL